jgi:hypothetical protein
MSFAEIRAEASDLWKKIVGEGNSADPDKANEVLKKVEMTFGRKMKLSEITEDQKDLFYLTLLDMRDMLAAK